jgi:hypothetical protein
VVPEVKPVTVTVRTVTPGDVLKGEAVTPTETGVDDSPPAVVPSYTSTAESGATPALALTVRTMPPAVALSVTVGAGGGSAGTTEIASAGP